VSAEGAEILPLFRRSWMPREPRLGLARTRFISGFGHTSRNEIAEAKVRSVPKGDRPPDRRREGDPKTRPGSRPTPAVALMAVGPERTPSGTTAPKGGGPERLDILRRRIPRFLEQSAQVVGRCADLKSGIIAPGLAAPIRLGVPCGDEGRA
jgi:hypothetical protein